MITEKANLDGTPVNNIDKDSLYMVDFSRCTNVNDLMIILSSIGFTFSPYHPAFETLRPFLDLSKPIPARQPMPQPEKKELELPKLKTLKK
jgi:hypothetical protein